jgi:hypothetical protein
MSTGIEVWITGEGTPCAVSLKEWKVCVFDCCRLGEVQLCEDEPCKTTKCGHVHFNVPPGCYFLRAFAADGDRAGLGVAIVSCGQEACVTLVSLRTHFALAAEDEKQWLIAEAEKMKPSQPQQPPTP